LFAPTDDPDLETLKNSVVDAGERSFERGRTSDLTEHLLLMSREFSGKSQLEFFHAATVVFIRRRLNLPETADRFWRMWRAEGDFLASRLDSRWLVSACDTIIDTANDQGERALAIAGTLYANTMKLYETERLALGTRHLGPENYDTGTGDARHELFDGVTAFNLGRGDMIAKLMRRLDRKVNRNRVAGRILVELIGRAHRSDTVYSRFAAAHERPKTAWRPPEPRGGTKPEEK
jgi:hypothetical protein